MNILRSARPASLLLYVLIASIALISAPVAAATDSAPFERETSSTHCVAEVTGQSVDGELRLAEPVCFTEFDSAMRFAGLPGADSVAPNTITAEMLAGSSIIAVHYSFTNYRGSSLAVSGSSCTGGYINFRTAYTNWNDRMWSTINGCGGRPITHWDIAPASGGNCSGSKYVAWSSVPNLGAMGGNTSCVYYGP